MSDSKSLNALLHEVKISSSKVCVFIRDLTDHMIQITFDGWWASMNVGSKGPIA
jgi:hypothetical protein